MLNPSEITITVSPQEMRALIAHLSIENFGLRGIIAQHPELFAQHAPEQQATEPAEPAPLPAPTVAAVPDAELEEG